MAEHLVFSAQHPPEKMVEGPEPTQNSTANVLAVTVMICRQCRRGKELIVSRSSFLEYRVLATGRDLEMVKRRLQLRILTLFLWKDPMVKMLFCLKN
ncbi:hypothetical protein ACOSQ3_012859 [Xanthoceras sorbifolium]